MSEDRYERKVKALLDRARHPNTPPEEAEQALAMAGALMAKHEIDEATLTWDDRTRPREEVQRRHFEVDGTGGFGVARCQAMGMVAVGMGARFVYSGSSGDRRLLVIVVGFASTLEHLALLYPAMLPVMEAGASRQRKWAREKEPSNRGYHHRSYRSYLFGFGEGMRGRLLQLRKVDAPTSGSTGELVLVDRAERVRRAFEELASGAVKSRGVRGAYDARQAGYRDGTSFASPAVGGQKKSLES